ncbi:MULTISPECIES: DUF5074 domain-containing protein [Myroides]|uniref:DUF5074 domain-containing protein n=1 Tax=Myroides albus TaxID=2562892 RepID=A0A6I3LGK1_9FLAO|nr:MULTISPECIES: DUF5074 domain-containing protein [Myroides]MTG96676.1 DUF5074 domain-containing protein [Myroides albus]MVX34688.1 DUF5074 domain-containing protein [Myroides sp. LoEW2-1]UVD80912.1 DUF5074 domain-containing protein [Myroides albus]
MIKIPYLKAFSLGLLTLSFACSSDDTATKNEDGFKLIPQDEIVPLIQPSGFYIANEDWFGHDGSNGTLNFIDKNYKPFYRVFREANPGKRFGVTTQSATTYGDYYYFVSKQGNRLVVTDKDLKEVKSLTDIGGDGRAFVGATASKGYISTSGGISIFNINTLEVEGSIAGIATETGNMAVANGLLFAVTNKKELHIIDVETDKLLISLQDNYTQLTLDNNGILWLGHDKEIKRLDTKTIDKNDLGNINMTSYDLGISSIKGQWGAWNAGSMTVSNDGEFVYWNSNGGSWNGGNKIAQLNTSTGVVNPEFYDLGHDSTEVKLAFYGSSMRIDPHTDNLVLTIKREKFGSAGSYNWVRIINQQGGIIQDIFLRGGTEESSSYNPDGGYFWFPSQVLFEDNNAPQIFTNQVILKSNKEFAIALDQFLIDQDSPWELIEKTASNLSNDLGTVRIENREFTENGKTVTKESLVFTTNTKIGKAHFTLEALSNGKVAKKDIEVWVRE